MPKATNLYIFGYGGLILAESRQMTLGSPSQATPVTLTGFERYWGFTAATYRLTSLSLKANESKTCAGVVFAITSEQLQHLDAREVGYERVTLAPGQLRFWQPQDIAAGVIYTYVALETHVPSAENPIVQSEVDAILTGCLQEYGEAFAREVVRTTSGWEHPWLNDRAEPRYPFGRGNGRFLPQIDQILQPIRPPNS